MGGSMNLGNQFNAPISPNANPAYPYGSHAHAQNPMMNQPPRSPNNPNQQGYAGMSYEQALNCLKPADQQFK